MKKSRLTEEQIIALLKPLVAARTLVDLSREHDGNTPPGRLMIQINPFVIAPTKLSLKDSDQAMELR